MSKSCRLAIGCATWILASFAVASADDAPSIRPHVGEVREIALAEPNQAELTQRMHHQGWLEADGRLLPVAQFEELYKQIGRSWTSGGVSRKLFALPRLHDVSLEPRSSDDPYGVLSHNIVLYRQPNRPAYPPVLSYWIFVGRDVEVVGAR
jgi:hypothetical protein